MLVFLDLPPEVVLGVLALGDATDAARFAQTCSQANELSHSLSLNKFLFLADFDLPPSPFDYDFESNLHLRIRARSFLASSATINSLSASPDDLESVLETLVDIADSRSPSSAALSRNQRFLTAHLPRDMSTVNELSQRRIGFRSLRRVFVNPASPLTQLAAQLHVLHTPSPYSLASPSVRTAAREVVYDQKNWLRSSQWGPFVTGTGGTQSKAGLVVDWHKLEALAVVMGANIREASPDWGELDVEVPEGWEATRPVELPEGRDWAGVESQAFMGTYAFVDYRTYEHFNFHRSSSSTPSLEDETEAVGECMKLTLKLTDHPSPLLDPNGPRNIDNADIESTDSDDPDDASFRTRSPSPSPAIASPAVSESEMDDDAGKVAIADVDELSAPTGDISPPPLAFTGTSERLSFSGTFANSAPTPQNPGPKRTIHGTVARTPEGFVHWTFVICYDAGPQWLMHGIQVGGAGSKFGILGTWSTADHDEAGPNGPFWYWPQSPV